MQLVPARGKTVHSPHEAGLSGLKPAYDVIVVGGGIQGATISWEAASRGLRVLLLEQNDFGSGVSANSLKTIHGGIRYLQSLDLSRMRQSVRERRTLLRIAPHLVRPMRCIIPAYAGLRMGKLALSTGTRMYDWIAHDRNKGLSPQQWIKGSEILTARDFARLCPVHDQKSVQGAVSWWDAQVYNSERLVLAFVMSARERGADTCNYVQVKDIIKGNGRVRGVSALDRLSGAQQDIEGRVIMDCTGHWLNTSPFGLKLNYARAMNVLIRQRLCDCAFGFRARGDGKRLLFFVPWRDGGMIGTWYNQADDMNDSDGLNVTTQEIGRALAEVNAALKKTEVEYEDVTAVHLGLLPALKRTNGSGEPFLSQRFMIADCAEEGAAGLFRIQGVKYTTARDVALKALESAKRYLSSTLKSSMTDVLPLYGGDIGDVESFYSTCLQQYASKFNPGLVNRLIANYGSKIHHIMCYVNFSSQLGQQVPGTSDVLQAELAYVLDHEMVRTLPDLIFRRTDLGSSAMPAEETIDFCADFMSTHLGWTALVRDHNIEDLYKQNPRWIQNKWPVKC
jgi:glycerol-3-phosphate dehydrogenase